MLSWKAQAITLYFHKENETHLHVRKWKKFSYAPTTNSTTFTVTEGKRTSTQHCKDKKHVKNMTISTKKYCGNKICALLYYSNRITGPHWFALISHLMVSLSSWWGRRTCSYPFSMLFCIFCFFSCNTSTPLYSSSSSIDRLLTRKVFFWSFFLIFTNGCNSVCTISLMYALQCYYFDKHDLHGKK